MFRIIPSGRTCGPASQNPFYNINAFAYPAAFTLGNAGPGIARTGWMWWPQYSITKTWAYRENTSSPRAWTPTICSPETRWLNTANSTVNFSSPQLFGKFPATTGYSYSNFYATEWHPTGCTSIRILKEGSREMKGLAAILAAAALLAAADGESRPSRYVQTGGNGSTGHSKHAPRRLRLQRLRPPIRRG